MTPQLSARIKSVVDEDVDTENLAVFEAIALNSKPLPYKNGSIFEKARVPLLTLQQMAAHLNSGNHIPLVSDHHLMGEPKGRAFWGSVEYDNAGDPELRILFYLDSTEMRLITKLNAGSLDEVSVQFLSSQFLCSACGWDYFGPEKNSESFATYTCANGHTIGENGVHAQLVGLDTFLELSLVARGAADTPKIVGRSASKLTPATQMRLAASGVEIEGLICAAIAGDESVSTSTPDFATLTADLVNARVGEATLTTQLSAATTAVTDLTAKLTAAEASVAELTTKLTAAEAQPTNEADYQVALAFLGEVFKKVAVAADGKEPTEVPATVAELTAAIKTHTNELTAILPVGGVAAGADSSADKPAIVASAFSNRKLGS